MSNLAIGIAGAIVLVLGAGWVAIGWAMDDIVVMVGGAMTVAAGLAMLGLAPRAGERGVDDE